MAYKTYLCRLCFYSILSSFPSVVLAAESVDQQREQGVADIQDGKVNQGFNQLKTLLEQDPQNQKLIADYVVLRYANAKFTDSDKAYLMNIFTINVISRCFFYLETCCKGRGLCLIFEKFLLHSAKVDV